jgi:hypothetical protein
VIKIEVAGALEGFQGKETGGVTICAMPVMTAIPIQNRACTSA